MKNSRTIMGLLFLLVAISCSSCARSHSNINLKDQQPTEMAGFFSEPDVHMLVVWRFFVLEKKGIFSSTLKKEYIGFRMLRSGNALKNVKGVGAEIEIANPQSLPFRVVRVDYAEGLQSESIIFEGNSDRFGTTLEAGSFANFDARIELLINDGRPVLAEMRSMSIGVRDLLTDQK